MVAPEIVNSTTAVPDEFYDAIATRVLRRLLSLLTEEKRDEAAPSATR